jgi:hypothetical protein
MRPGGRFPVLVALTVGHLRRQPPAFDLLLRVLEPQLEIDASPALWLALAPRLRPLIGAEGRERTACFIEELFSRVPEVRDSVEGLHLIAAAMGRLPDATVERWMRALDEGSWDGRRQAFGELLVLFATRADASPEARQRLADELKDGDEDVRMGIAFGAAHLWQNLERRGLAHKALLGVANASSARVEAAAMKVFVVSEALLADDATFELLSLLASKPSLCVAADPRALVDRLSELMPTEARLVGEVAHALVAAIAGSARPMALFSQGPKLVDIAMTLQRMGGPLRSTGLDIFEALLGLDAYGVRDALATFDPQNT